MTILKFRFLSIIRNRILLFWNLIFPLVLVTFFAMTLPNAYKTVEINTIPIAIVQNEAYDADTVFQKTLKEVEKEEQPLFQIHLVSRAEADTLLENGEIDGIIEKDVEFHIYVKERGIHQTILQSFMDEYLQKSSMMQHLLAQGSSIDQILDSMSSISSYLQPENPQNPNVSIVFFYTIIAMCCLYGSYISMNCISSVQANQSAVGARNSISPLPKSRLIAIDFLVSYSIDFLILLIMMGYMRFVLDIDFGSHVCYMLVSVAAGILAGNSLGVFVGVAIIKKKDFKTGLLTVITLGLSTLSGMMFVQLKYFMDTNLPLLSRINPANMITDSLYALYYYGPNERYLMGILSLVIFSLLCYGGAYIVIRRKQYASI